MRIKYFVFFLIMFVFINFANAVDFYLGNPENNIANNYAKSSYLGGWINISFNNISSDSLFTDSLNHQIYLTDILSSPQNLDYIFSCDTTSCLSSYDVLNPETTKTFHLNENATKLVGIGFEENIEDIISISFDVFSTTQGSCLNQIAIDVFDDGTIDYINNQAENLMCSDVYKGCSEITGGPNGNNSGGQTEEDGSEDYFSNIILSLFKIKKTGKVITGNIIQTSDVVITEIPLCQRIEFPVGPNYEVGAWIKEETSGTKQFNIDIYTLNSTKIDFCPLSKANLPQGGSAYLGCNTDFYLIKPEELYVCLSATTGTGRFVTKGYIPPGEKCAFQGLPPKSEVAAYDIYVRKQKFKSLLDGLTISNNLSEGITLANLIKNSIIQNYGGLNCTDGCAVPIRIYSQTNQNITLKNISIVYQGTLGQTESKEIYDIQENIAKINSNYQKLYLDGFFQLPSISQSINYSIKLNNGQVLNKNITIKNITMTINPAVVSVGLPSSFSVQISPPQTIKKYIWTFGDASNIIETNNNSASHTYSEIRNYSINVKVITNSNETYFKISKIEVISPANNLGQMFADKKAEIQNIKDKLNSLDNFSASKIKQYINLEQTESNLNDLESEYNSTTNETEILEIANELFALPIPDDMIINPKEEKNISIISKNIDLISLSSIIGKEINQSDANHYKNAIINWNNQNTKIKISANRFDFSVNDIIEEGFSIYNLDIKNKGQDNFYLIIADLNDFDSTEIFSQGSNSYYMLLSEENNQIKIASSENLNIEELPFFISPDISKLDLANVSTNQNKKLPINLNLKDSLIYLAIGIGALAIILVIYFIYNKFLYRKKKSKIEETFKDKNELYNIMNYIENSKRNGMGDSEIINNLKESKWNNAQIKYAMDMREFNRKTK